jgi:hypothetical protein
MLKFLLRETLTSGEVFQRGDDERHRCKNDACYFKARHVRLRLCKDKG